ncbi:MAG TPA: bifunctional DNA-binding transcriptional regulator/O6-methylguanine-DNA methyltransferase Ada [Candidatus Eisenbacteria bacterium]
MRHHGFMTNEHGPAPPPPADRRLDGRRWRRVLARDPGADGAFVFAVRSTGIYCRPSCPARRPRRDRVLYVGGPAEAERAGFRACRRCHPREESMHDQHAALVRQACEMIESSPDRPPSLAALGRRIGYSPFHLHRMFRRVTGVTPRQYAEAVRTRRLRAGLGGGSPVAHAVYDAGFGSASRVYARAHAELGMTPAAFRRGGRGVAVAYALARSPLGWILVATTTRGVCAVRLGDSAAGLAAGLRRELPAAALRRDDARLAPIVRRVLAGVDGGRPDPRLPLDIRATAFQRRVWQALRAIPRGETRTYAQIARAVGRPGAARAVGSACARNPVALVIPCHRAVRGDGGLGGYAWGIERKRRLLERERGAAAGRR